MRKVRSCVGHQEIWGKFPGALRNCMLLQPLLRPFTAPAPPFPAPAVPQPCPHFPEECSRAGPALTGGRKCSNPAPAAPPESSSDFYSRDLIFRMSVNTSTAGKGVDPNAVDTYDSGDDWEIGVGNLIIDLDADLEKDRQKFEMNNSTNTTTTTSSSTSSKDCGGLASSGANATSALADGLKFASVQPPAPQGNSSHKETSKSKVKRSKTSKDANKSLPSAALYGIPEISSAGKRQEVQGRPGEATGMNSALGQSVSSNPNGNNNNTSNNNSIASCGKNKEEKPGKTQGSRGSKRDKDAGKSRKDKQHDLQQGHPNGGGGSSQAPSGHLYGFGAKGGGGGSNSPFHCASSTVGEVSKSAPDSGLMGNSILVKKEEEEEENHRRIKKLKTEKYLPKCGQTCVSCCCVSSFVYFKGEFEVTLPDGAVISVTFRSDVCNPRGHVFADRRLVWWIFKATSKGIELGIQISQTALKISTIKKLFCILRCCHGSIKIILMGLVCPPDSEWYSVLEDVTHKGLFTCRVELV
ncbi:hypothetical protein UY3_08072 [Chelonia mydas]|uniref:Zinc finger protein 608 n=1 Tax=Chelonia mydas TaxID=8469 RepID=M7BGN4_CHEMY|nr:hypothetical protein UY3_08072 [Chelonia mydas]